MPYKVDFKEIATSVDIEAVATFIGLMCKRTSKDLRSACPACKSGDERSLQIIPETNSFRCHAAQQSGDCIALYAHINGTGMYKAALALQDRFGTATAAPAAPATAPQKTEGRANVPTPKPSKPEAAFDPAAFGAKLAYTEEVAAVGFTEEDAERFGVGFYRGRVYIPIRDTGGSIAGFIGYANGEIKMPPKWLAAPSNVVALRRA
jgi:DNA primase